MTHRTKWQIDTIYCESLDEGIRLGANIFRDSEYGRSLRSRFKTGDRVRLTVERLRPKRQSKRAGAK